MFNVGEFAKLGRVSVRQLRHYDATGLLRPSAVDPFTGYRSYSAVQLHHLNRLIALKKLGLTLQQVRESLDDKLDIVQLRAMLRLRRAQLEARMSADASRLAGIEARLRMIEGEGRRSSEEVVLTEVGAVRVAELTATAAGYAPEDVVPVLTPLLQELDRRLGDASVRPSGGPAMAYYEPDPAEAGETVFVHVAMPVAAVMHPDYDFAIVRLPPIRSAATVIHHGSLDDVLQSLHTIALWIEHHGYRPVGHHREVFLSYHPDSTDEGVIELQVAVVKQ